MPCNRNIINLIRFITIIKALETIWNTSQFQSMLEWTPSNIGKIYQHIEYDDLRILTRLTLETFN